jgi:hypothetical protein
MINWLFLLACFEDLYYVIKKLSQDPKERFVAFGSRIIQNLWFWSYIFTMFMGNPSWVFPVEKALTGERITFVATIFCMIQISP